MRTTFSLEAPYDPAGTLSVFGMGRTDPCLRIDGKGGVRFGTLGPSGPLFVRAEVVGTALNVEVDGADADWLERSLVGLLGLDFEVPRLGGPRRLREVAHRHRGTRLPRSPLFLPRLVPILLQQLVAWDDATHGWRQLVRRHGTPSPLGDGVHAPPGAEVLARMASHEFVQCGILPEHGRRIVRVARESRRIEAAWANGLGDAAIEEACRVLAVVRGIGPWTLGFLRGTAMGDRDAFVPGDYGLPGQVSHFFGERLEKPDDDDLRRLLEPYRPNRFYVLWLIIKSKIRPPRRAPRGMLVRDRIWSRRR